MKIIRIHGGLGNQMFQYALAIKLKHLFPNEKVLIDLIQFKGYPWNPYELDKVFARTIPIASFSEVAELAPPFSEYTRCGKYANIIYNKLFGNRLRIERERKPFLFDESVLNKDGNCYYDGYWCNQGYFADIRPQILDVFTFKLPLSEQNVRLKTEIENCNSVSIHVRRGDYLLYDEYKNICEKPYYINAIKYINEKVENPHFFVFSNDIQWCKDNLSDIMDNYTFSDNHEPKNNYADMQLMSCCKHNIIAHSTFSWWAAWLNQNSEKIVVAPDIWNNNYKDAKPQLDEWILIKN